GGGGMRRSNRMRRRRRRNRLQQRDEFGAVMTSRCRRQCLEPWGFQRPTSRRCRCDNNGGQPSTAVCLLLAVVGGNALLSCPAAPVVSPRCHRGLGPAKDVMRCSLPWDSAIGLGFPCQFPSPPAIA